MQYKAKISGVGKYLPDQILTNKELEGFVDTNDEWIQSRTGIKERRVVSKGEASAEMSTKAITNLLNKYLIRPEEIDVIIIATITPDMMFPATAAIVQKNIKASNAWGFDISAACSGFLFALQTGATLIGSGNYKKIIVVGVDTMSSILDYKDRNTCILFGDGAGAVLLEPSNNYGIIDSELRIDGNGGEFLYMSAGGSLLPATNETVNNKMHYVRQEGKIVFKHAVREMTHVTKKIINRNNLNIKNINLFIPHQANQRIIDAVGNKIGLEKSQVMINIDKYANTTSATLPICISEAVEKKMLKKGDNLILSTFGAGFSWGAMYIKWGIN